MYSSKQVESIERQARCETRTADNEKNVILSDGHPTREIAKNYKEIRNAVLQPI